ncbi:RimK family alpha-L-glutamate ligase [Halegenticoccus tardaugens]|uniref:RimK family alpha-L-glutamate ligase n=1 Tax=Halegenticoccus tardaugens TaxID=2071624 RepID=UPI00100BBC00|nr:RimK family alpha-L-glutamate ligase [Halegenticoccus tardaugens]
MAATSVRVGVLSLHNSRETKAILNAVEALGHRPEWLREENTVFRVTGGRPRLSPDVDVVVNRLLVSNVDRPAEHLGVARTIAGLRPTLNHPDAVARAAHKTATAALLARDGIPTPDAAFALCAERLTELRGEFGEEVVYKTAIGTHGGTAWKLDSAEPLAAAVGSRRAFLQEFVSRGEGRPRDLRVYVVADAVVGAMYRYAPAGEWRTNVARGGEVEDATETLSDEAARLARRATAVVGLDYAGVDLIECDGRWLVLEVNPTAGFRGLYRATGRSPAPSLAALAIERAGGRVDADLTGRLAATLDDSEPSCTPSLARSVAAEQPVIGFTERVVVSGTTGTKAVVGKSDTGAARTSVDLRLAAEIGAGPIHTVSTVRSGGTRRGRSRPVVDLVLGVGGRQHTVAANIEDRGHMDYPLLIGRDVLQHYVLDIGRRVDDRASRADGGT